MAQDKVSISIRLDAELHQHLVAAAAKAKSPLNGEIQRRLAQSLGTNAADCSQLEPQLTRIEHAVNAVAHALLKKGK